MAARPAVGPVLGIDLGGTKAALRAEGEDGASEESVLRWRAPADPAADWAALTADVRALRSRWGDFAAVGVAMPALLDREGTVSTWPGRPSWSGFRFVDGLRRVFPGTPVRWADDGDLAALAESVHAGRDDVVYLGVGTGVGGGIVRAGRLFPGPERGSCEVGHIVIDRAGARCDCGRRGCLQATASGPATLRRAAELRGSATDFAGLREALADRVPWAVRAVDASCAAVAAAVVSLAELAHPETTVIGGGFAAGLAGFTARVEAHTRQLARPGTAAPAVTPAALGSLSSLHGALALAREARTASGRAGSPNHMEGTAR
ncbi:MAG: ROK family protein [Streptomycetaceae bacterium]|nr:ROK family protein [Streptomycetaceae bacterium]